MYSTSRCPCDALPHLRWRLRSTSAEDEGRSLRHRCALESILVITLCVDIRNADAVNMALPSQLQRDNAPPPAHRLDENNTRSEVGDAVHI